MTSSINVPVYSDALVLLGTAGVVIPLVRRFGFNPVLGYLGAGAILGPLGVGSFIDQFPLLSWFTVVDAEITETSDGRVFGGFTATARGRASGVETDLNFWTVFWFSDGKIVRRLVFWTRDEALEAAGLEE